MKKYKFFALAFAALTLGACSSDDVVDNGQPGTVPAGEPGYVSLAINLPTQPSTRAEDFDDGLESEYAVNNATLFLFAGRSEANATFRSAYDLSVAGFTNDASDQVTEKATIVQEITVPSTPNNENIYALVILNDHNLIEVSDGSATVNKQPLTAGTSNLTAFTEAIQNFSTGAAALTGAGGIFMSNAPLYNVQGGSVDPENGAASTLASIDKDKIKTTATEAATDPAATIYVERAVAKVTLNDNGGGTITPGEGANANLASYQIQGWTFNNENTKTYFVRNVATADWWRYTNTAHALGAGADAYRFVGGLQVNSGETPALYRTYWGIDPNYSTFNAADFIVKDEQEIANKALIGLGAENPGYCLENTFDIANQLDDRTTSVVVKAKLSMQPDLADQDGSFYTVNDNTGTVYKRAGVESYVKALAMDRWVRDNWDTYAETDLTGEELDVTLSNETANKGGYITVTGIELPSTVNVAWKLGQSRDIFNAALAAQLTAITENLKIGYYKEGMAYYTILIKHFGDSQTPWEDTDIQNGNSYAGANPTANWLGRYGALRNNWYEINVSGIKNIGSPSVPNAEGDPDDPSTSYIAVEINVLSWAKRTQSADL